MNRWEISFFGWHKIAGVYCVCTIDTNNKTKIHYIGSSSDIQRRVMSIHHPYRWLLYLDSSPFIKFKETSEYKKLEERLIYKLKPELNTVYKNG